MKKVNVTILFSSILVFLSLFLSSCGVSKTAVIFKPELSYRSPALDFTKMQAIAIMPVNSYSNEVVEITSLVNDGLPAELERTQIGLKIFSYADVLRTLNKKGLGRGYHNYIADLNTYVTAAGMTPNFTSETQTFFDQFKKEMNFQAILFTSYGFFERTITKPGFLNYGTVQTIEKTLSVTVVLYDLTSRRAWWVAKLSLTGGENFTNAELARKVIEGIASNFGKGELRQL